MKIQNFAPDVLRTSVDLTKPDADGFFFDPHLRWEFVDFDLSPHSRLRVPNRSSKPRTT